MELAEYDETLLSDLLPLYYNRLFPKKLIYQWLCYGNADRFSKREISFTLVNDVYIRFLSFDSLEMFSQSLVKKAPVKIDIGGVYRHGPQMKMFSSINTLIERELVFDIDLTDYDSVRTCCAQANVCCKCWKFMVIACKILDAGLRDDFGFKNVLWVFSGRRGIHCWVADELARTLTETNRSSIVNYFVIQSKKYAKLSYEFHPSLRRAVDIIDNYFETCIIQEQNYLGNDEGLKKFALLIGQELYSNFPEIRQFSSSEERWNYFVKTFRTLLQKNELPKYHRYLIEEIKLRLCLPRLDVNVSTSLKHLLKSPFSIHPKTGKVSVPIDPKFIDNFDPDTVPTINQLIDEINQFEAKSAELKQESDKSSVIVEDFRKTSLLPHINTFKEFLRDVKNCLE